MNKQPVNKRKLVVVQPTPREAGELKQAGPARVPSTITATKPRTLAEQIQWLGEKWVLHPNYQHDKQEQSFLHRWRNRQFLEKSIRSKWYNRRTIANLNQQNQSDARGGASSILSKRPHRADNLSTSQSSV